MYETLDVSTEGPIGRLRLNRPEKLNPLSARTLSEIAQAAQAFDRDAAVKVVIVEGAGRAFSAGADLEGMTQLPEGLTTHRVAQIGQEMADALESMRPLAIGAIQGWCVGGGLVLAAACDLRIAAEGTRFSIPEVDLGIPLAWGGIPRLVREIGPARTKELVLTCRPFDAEEALAAGFLNRIVPADSLSKEAESLAESLAQKAGHAIFSTKRHVNSVTDQMVGTMRGWADADGLVAAFGDPEAGEARRRYLASKAKS